MLYKNDNILIPFKGDYKPVNVYKGSEKISGWEEKTFTGTSLSIADTYNDYFHELTLTGRYQQSEPSIENPAYPTFSGNCTLTVNDYGVSIPTLRAVSDYADEIKVTGGQVLQTEKIKVVSITASNANSFIAYIAASSWINNHMCVWWNGGASGAINNVGLNSHMAQRDTLDLLYPHQRGITENVAIENNRLFISVRRETLGLTSDLPLADCVTAIRNWLIGLYNGGNPVTFYMALTTPITTDITSTDLGRALLALQTTPYTTHIYDNGTLPCDKTATLKVFRRTI